MTGLLTNNTVLSYKTGTQTEFAAIDYLMEVPEMGGAPQKVDVTTLRDRSSRFIPGVIDHGDLVFKFLYDNGGANSNYRVLKGLQSSGALATFKLEYPDGTGHQFDAYVAVKMDAGASNAALTFTASMYLQSEITETDPA